MANNPLDMFSDNWNSVKDNIEFMFEGIKRDWGKIKDGEDIPSVIFSDENTALDELGDLTKEKIIDPVKEEAVETIVDVVAPNVKGFFRSFYSITIPLTLYVGLIALMIFSLIMIVKPGATPIKTLGGKGIKKLMKGAKTKK